MTVVKREILPCVMEPIPRADSKTITDAKASSRIDRIVLIMHGGVLMKKIAQTEQDDQCIAGIA